ncbi:hypothetical protein [Methanohalophilus portucalensis]|uniref:hypothetical protein n=1 Tax=Methanohalophilus portucalensis TaxID=39664 RepID=UPI00118102DE|nr:hypothetical protein [Methanohalophilus portucalensis]
MERNKVIGIAFQISLIIILFELIDFVSGNPRSAGVALTTSFLCGILFKYAGDWKRNPTSSRKNRSESELWNRNGNH